VEVVGSGSVEAGRDIAENGHGFARICPRSPSSLPALTLTLSTGTGRVAWEIGGSTTRRGVGSWQWNTAANTLDDRLRAAGYTSFDPADIREAVTVINGVLGGPKGTTMKGQSQRLRVRSAHSVRERPSAPLQPSPCEVLIHDTASTRTEAPSR
jgi:hypothetical protein